jgi:glutamine synthetase
MHDWTVNKPRANGLEEVRRATRELQSAGIGTAIVAGADTHGLLRGKRIAIGELPTVAAQGLPMCEVFWALQLDEAGPVARPTGLSGWFPQPGYPDILARLDMSTLRERSWERGAAQILCDFTHLDGTPLAVCPRTILHEVVRRAARDGLEALVGVELECSLLEETPASVKAKRPSQLVAVESEQRVYGVSAVHRLEGFARRLHDSLAELAIPVLACHPEEGPGQLEITIGHADPVLTADRAVLVKHAAKALAAQEGRVATFMAKPRTDWPGNSCHLHVSLRAAGRDAFHFDDGLSPAMGSFIAGTLEHMPELTAVMAPTVNSYRRFVRHSWAATTETWAIDNRTAGLRAVCHGEHRTRLEHRQAGADTNPYLAIAAALAAGLDGVRRRCPAPAPVEGDIYAEPGAPLALPRTLEHALDLLQHSELVKDWLGAEFVEHFVAMRRAELTAQAIAVTDWETARYLVAL